MCAGYRGIRKDGTGTAFSCGWKEMNRKRRNALKRHPEWDISRERWIWREAVRSWQTSSATRRRER